jgi:two-component system chemotaxis sensor kinase CheA
VDGWLARLALELAELGRRAAGDATAVERATSRLLDQTRRLRQRTFADIFEPLPRALRDVAVRLGREARLELHGQEVEADRTVLDALREPVLHLVRNAVDHGLEPPDERRRGGKPAEGVVRIAAALHGDRVLVTVEDDGRGLDIAAIRAALARRGRAVPASDREAARTLFESGVSTRDQATEISGRGVGLDVVREAVERLGGTVEVRWREGGGTTFTIDAPVSVASLRALLVTAGGQPIAVPTAFVQRVERVPAAAPRLLDGRAVLPMDGAPVPLTTLARLLGPPLADARHEGTLPVVLLQAGGERLAVVVDDLLDEREVAVRPIDGEVGERYAGAALLREGGAAPVLDVPSVIGARGGAELAPAAAAAEARRPRILVVDDSITTRTLEESVLTAAGFDVVTAVDGADGWRRVEEGGIDLVVTDIEMPRLDGLALCERIRGTPATARLPVILVTSLDRPEQRARGLEAGADAYIAKSSFDQDALLATVRQLLGDAG